MNSEWRVSCHSPCDRDSSVAGCLRTALWKTRLESDWYEYTYDTVDMRRALGCRFENIVSRAQVRTCHGQIELTRPQHLAN